MTVSRRAFVSAVATTVGAVLFGREASAARPDRTRGRKRPLPPETATPTVTTTPQPVATVPGAPGLQVRAG